VPVFSPLPPATHIDGICDRLLALHEAYTHNVAPWSTHLQQPGPLGCLHFYADGGIYLFAPHFGNDPAFTTTRTSAGSTTTTTQQFGYDMAFAPRVEAGVVGPCGLGFRAGWWHFDQGSNPLDFRSTDRTLATTYSTIPEMGIPGFTTPGAVARRFGVFADQLDFVGHLKLDALDWEVTQDLRLDWVSLLFSGGVRYAYLSQDYQASRFNSGSGATGRFRVNLVEDADFVRSGHNFAGTGPTTALSVRRSLGMGGFALYGLGRASVLFGRSHIRSSQDNEELQVFTLAGRALAPAASSLLTRAEDSRDEVVPVAEVEVGIEWTYDLGPVGLFVRTGLVGQEWWGAGNATGQVGNLGFFGLTVLGGVSY
jgi:hypothetical protein